MDSGGGGLGTRHGAVSHASGRHSFLTRYGPQSFSMKLPLDFQPDMGLDRLSGSIITGKGGTWRV
jgi:hypothetical protein